jgi:hypothetical protein
MLQQHLGQAEARLLSVSDITATIPFNALYVSDAVSDAVARGFFSRSPIALVKASLHAVLTCPFAAAATAVCLLHAHIPSAAAVLDPAAAMLQQHLGQAEYGIKTPP